MRKFINGTNAAGLHITEASPIDDRLEVTLESNISALSNVEPMPNIMYDGMVIKCGDTGKSYIWVESDFGLMVDGFTYPVWYEDIQGHDYAGKKYNFVLFDATNKVEILYDNPSISGILVPNNKIPYRLIDNKEDVCITLKSQSSSFEEVEFPDKIEVTPDGIFIRFDPAPNPPELFKITIY